MHTGRLPAGLIVPRLKETEPNALTFLVTHHTNVINRTDGFRLQVDYGKDETALAYLWQARPG